MNASIKDNIILGRAYNPERYFKILKFVCLEDDISNMIGGDENVVSERGGTLSEGQKARISYARVLYSETDTYILDDPFSSLDPKMMEKSFKNTILDLLANKTRVLVMRNHDYLKYADKIVLIENCKMEFFGAYNEFKESYAGINFDEFRIENKIALEVEDITLYRHNMICDPELNLIYQKPLKLSTIYKYFNLGCRCNLILILCFIAGCGSLAVMVYFYFKIYIFSDSTQTLESILIIALLVLVYYICLILLIQPLSYNTMKSNLTLHNNATKSLSKCSPDHFNKHICRTIFNNFTNETSTIDSNLSTVFQDTSVSFFSIFGILICIIVIIPFSIIYTSLLFIEFYFLSNYVLSVYNKIKRLGLLPKAISNSSTNSNLFGLATIRSLKIQQYIYEKLEKNLLELFRISLTGYYFSSLYIDSCEQGIALSTIINLIIIIATDGFFNQDLSLIMFSVLVGLNFATAGLLSMITQFDLGMLSAQNLFDICQFPKEKNTKENIIKDFVISNGKIEFISLSVKYENKIALNKISCVIQPKSKVVIIGKTGAGKSTIFKTILRLINPSSGTILIDGQDYLEFAFKSVRKSIAASPQSCVIFYGSVRQNLDPFKLYSDDELNFTLNKLKLDNIIQKKLDDETFGIESKFSVGERQLFCLARILLKKNKLVLIDEATSSIDAKTDLITQKILKTELADCTILTISHRPTTFQDYDTAMAIDNGELVEFGLIKDLDSDPNSHFRKFKETQY